MFGRIALTACLGLFPVLANAQYTTPGFPAGGGFPNMGLNNFQNPFTAPPMGNSANPFPSQLPSPYGQQFFGFPQQATGANPYAQPQLNGQRPLNGPTSLPFAQPTPYWMQTPTPQSYLAQPQAAPPQTTGPPAARQSPPPAYFQYAPSPTPTAQPPRWAPTDGSLPSSTGNLTGNTWSAGPEAQPNNLPASPPRWPTP